MPVDLISGDIERRFRLAVLLSLGGRLVLCPLGFFLSYHFVVKHPKYFAVLATMFVAGVGWKLTGARKFFRKKDWISAGFGLLVLYVISFIGVMLWFWLQPPRKADDWAVAAGLLLMSGLFVGAGCLLLLSPRVADDLNRLCDGKVELARTSERKLGFHIGKRMAGLFLATVGCVTLIVGVHVARELWVP